VARIELLQKMCPVGRELLEAVEGMPVVPISERSKKFEKSSSFDVFSEEIRYSEHVKSCPVCSKAVNPFIDKDK
jgi:hypothetical protein